MATSLRDEMLAKYGVSPALGKSLPSKAASAASAGVGLANDTTPPPINAGKVINKPKTGPTTQTQRDQILEKYIPSSSVAGTSIPSSKPTQQAPLKTTAAISASQSGGDFSKPIAPLDIPNVDTNVSTSGVSTKQQPVVDQAFKDFSDSIINAPAGFANQVFKNIRASTQVIATPLAGAGGLGFRATPEEEKGTKSSGVSTPQIIDTHGESTNAFLAMQESLKSAKEMLLDEKVPVSQGINEAAKQYMDYRKKQGDQGKTGFVPAVADVAMLGMLGFFDMFGDPATAVGINEVRALKEFATFKKVGSVTKDLGEILPSATRDAKIVNPINRTIDIGDNLRVKIKPQESEVVIEGFARRFPKKENVVQALESGATASKEGAQAAASQTTQQAAEEVQSILARVSEGSNINVRATIAGEDLVLKPVFEAKQTANVARETINQQPAQQETNTVAENLANEKINPSVLDRIQALTPAETSAFGKKIVSDLSQKLGFDLALDPNSDKLPEDTFLKTSPSVDGRPATINQKGQIEVFLPNLVQDIKTMAAGGKILAHGAGSGQYAQVYKMQPGESMSSLATRYITDVLTHERAHLETITAADINEQKVLQNRVYQAMAAKSSAARIEAQTKLDTFMQGLEDKANAYARDNRTALEKKVFNGRKIDTSGLVAKPTTQKSVAVKQVEKVTNVRKPSNAKLTNKLKSQEVLAERAANAGRAQRSVEARNELQTAKAGEKRKTELKLFKQRIQDRSRYTDIISKIEDKQLSIEQKKKELVGFTDLLPLKVRGKFIKSINNMKSDTQFKNVIERIRKQANTEERSTLLREIVKEIKKTKIKGAVQSAQGKFGPAAQRELDIIRRNIKGDYAKAQEKIIEIVESKSTKDAEGQNEPLSPEEQKQIELLKMVGIADMDAKELRYVLNNIKSLKETGRTLRQAELEARATEDEAIKANGLGVLTGDGTAVAKNKGKVTISMIEKQSFLQKAKNFVFNTGVPGLDNLLDRLSFFDKKSASDESFLNKKFGRDIHEAGNNEFLGTKEKTERIYEDIKKAYGVASEPQALAKIAELNEDVNLGDFRATDGQIKNLTMERGQMINLYQMQKRPRLDETIALQFTPEQLAAIDQALTPEDKAMGDAMLKFADDYYDRINAVFSKQQGFDLPREEFYFPVWRQGADLDALSDLELLEGDKFGARPTTKNRSLKASTKSKLPLDLRNPVSTMLWYTNRMEHYINFAEPARQMKKFFSDKEVRQAIIDYHSLDAYKQTQQMLNNIIRGGMEKAKINRFVSALAGKTASALLSFNPNSAIGQLVDFFVYPLKMPATSYFANVAKFWMNPKKNYQFMRDNSVFLRERMEKGYSDEIRAALDADSTGKRSKLDRARRFVIGKIGFAAFEGVDRLISIPGMYAAYEFKYNELIKNGIPVEQAKKDAIFFAEKITKNLRETSRIDAKSELEMQGSFVRLFNMFRSQQAKLNGVIIQEARNFRSGRGPYKEAYKNRARSAKIIYMAGFLVPMMYQLFANRDASKKEQAANALLSPVTNIPIAGNIAQVMLDNAFGQKYEYRPSVITSFVTDLTNAVKDATGNNASLGKAALDVLDVAGKLTGTPTTIFTRPTRNSIREKDKQETASKKVKINFN